MKLTGADTDEINRRWRSGEMINIIAKDYGLQVRQILQIVKAYHWSEADETRYRCERTGDLFNKS